MSDIKKQIDLNNSVIKALIEEMYENEENKDTNYEEDYTPGDEQCYLWYWEKDWRKEYGDYVIDFIKKNYIKLYKILIKKEYINKDFD